MPGWIAPSGRTAALQIACVDGHAAQFAPCIASRWEQSNRTISPAQGIAFYFTMIDYPLL
ncbi:MAG: hypothetical protein WC091_22530 [Sulfuricellaceae bacterium]